MRCLYVDILGRPQQEFYRSTYREIFYRWDCYAEAKGYKEKVDKVQEFDD